MNVNLITVPKDIAKREYQEYADALKKGRKEDYLEEMKKLNYYLAKGKKVIDVFSAFEEVGLNDLHQPKLGICSATAKECFFEKTRNGGGAFRAYNQSWSIPKSQIKMSIIMPEHTYDAWPTQNMINNVTKNTFTQIKDPIMSTKVPIVPARLLPKGGLDGYHIIWEVDKWQTRRAPIDPILVKRITKNLFVVLSVWDLTPLERAVVEGR